MNADRLRSIAEQKALLRSRAELDRTTLALAMLDIRATFTPARDVSGASSRRPLFRTLIGFAAPLLGATGLARWLRVISFSLAAIRVVRNWRRMH